jgi:hypothetical protein
MSFSPKVEIETYGDYLEVCVAQNVRQLADLVAKKSEIKHITFLGGSPNLKILKDAMYEDQPPKTKRKTREYELELKSHLNRMKNMMGPHRNKFRMASPIKYKPSKETLKPKTAAKRSPRKTK